MLFYPLLLVREELTLDGEELIGVKFFPITHPLTKDRYIIDAEDAVSALNLAHLMFPSRLHLAVESKATYDRTIANLVAKRLQRRDEARRPRTPVTPSSGGNRPARRPS